MQRITIETASLAVAEAGSGDPLVLIHGSVDGIESFRRQIPSLASRYRVVRYARRHHPPSEGGGEYTLERHVADLRALMDALGIDAAHLAGSSYGAYVAIGLALREPSRVRSLVLGEPPVLPMLERTEEGRQALRAFRAGALDPAREAFGRGDRAGGVRLFVDGIRGMRGAFDALPEQSRRELARFGPELELELTTPFAEFMPDIPCEELGGLRLPVLLVTGERSPRLFHLITDELERCLPRARRTEVPGAGHAMHAMNVRAYTEAVMEFLRQAG